MRKIAFFSQKGGCGKTTACVNIAAVLATMGRRVLVIDLDSNACASRTFDFHVPFEDSVAAALVGVRPLAEVIRTTYLTSLYLAPGAPDLHTVEFAENIEDVRRLDAAGRLSEIALAVELSGLAADAFEYVLIDCAGGHPFMEHLALLAADEVIVPTGLSIYDLYATTPSLNLMLEARQFRNEERPAFLGFLPNGAGKAGVPSKMQGKLSQYGLPCFSPVRHSALIRSIAARPRIEQRLLAVAQPDHPAAASYWQVAREIDLGIEAARVGGAGGVALDG
jgi:cellulose biosynthesis protein BcsQ